MNALLHSKRLENKEYPKLKTVIISILKVSIPAALETLLIGLMGLIDTIMIGNYNILAMASVSLCQQPIFLTMLFSFGFNAGITTIISRRKGENDRQSAKESLKQAVIISSIIGLVISILVVILARPILIFSKAQEDTIDMAVIYFSIVSSSLVFNYIRNVICSGLRAEGDTLTTLLTNLVANVLNVFLNYCLIFGNLGFKELGITGAAIATATGNIVAFTITIFIYRFKHSLVQIKRNEKWRLDKKTINVLVKTSGPALMEQSFMRIGFYIIAIMVNGLGTKTVAINAIIAGVITLSFNISDGFAIGCSSLVGRSVGQKDYHSAYKIARVSQILSFLLGLMMIGIIIIFAFELSSLFTKDTSIINDSTHLLILSSFVIIPQSLQWITTNALRGSGDVKYIARTSIISVAIIRPIAVYAFCYILSFGLIGSWMGMFIDQTVRFAMNNNRLTKLKWINIKL